MKARVFVKVLAAHVVILGVLLVGSLVKNWFKPDPIPVMDVTLVSDPMAAKPAADKPAPQPPKPTPKPPTPAPKPDPVVKPTPPPKPKPKLKKASEIKVSTKPLKRRTGALRR